MNALLRFEAWCAAVVERSFALAFPGSLEPVQIARRLIATIDRAPPDGALGSTRYVVRIAEKDFARLAPDRALLERQWTTMAAALCERAAGRAVPISVGLVADGSLVAGTVVVDVSTGDGEPRPERAAAALRLRILRGGVLGGSFSVPRPGRGDAPVVVGRDDACDIVVADARVSRRHLRLTAHRCVEFEDLGSSNGTFRNGERLASGQLHAGDAVAIGDTTLEFFEERRE